MGLIYTKIFGRPSTKDLLEKIANDETSIEEFKRDTRAWHKKIIGYLLVYFSSLYLLAAVVVYFKFYHDPQWQDVVSQLKLFLPFLIAPFILWVVKRGLTWWYHRKLRRNEETLVKLREQKTKLLEEVMETETYKVAKEILDKYGSAEQQLKRPGASPKPSTDLRRRQTVANPVIKENAPQPGTPAPGPSSLRLTQSFRTSPNPSERSMVVDRSMARLGNDRGDSPNRPMHMQRQQRPPPGPPLPRPIMPRERGYMDKMVEYLVGDGPSNRYAMICKQCQSHNGMALKEEFEYIAYRCCYCYYWNPARKQRPTAPKLPTAVVRKDSSASESADDETAKETTAKFSDLPASDAPKRPDANSQPTSDSDDQKLSDDVEMVEHEDVEKPDTEKKTD